MKITKHLKFIIPSLIFFIMMEFFFKSLGLSYFSLAALFLISILSAFWITRYRFMPIILVMLFVTGSVLFFLTLGKSSFQNIYIFLSSFLFMLTLIGLNRFFGQQERYAQHEEMKPKVLDSGFNLNQTITLISFFLLSSGVYGIHIDLDFSVWVVMILIFLVAFFSTLYLTKINFLKSKALGLHLDSVKNKTFLLYSFLSGLVAVELIWAMSFLPINHLTLGGIALSLYYTFWNILKNYLRNELSRKVIVFNLMFFAVTTSVILFTSEWDIS
jgi:hypothetical protein